ncbi:hypothetical protein OG935_06210 [Nocardia cyriacigeorgica]|uniref:hypothetical protein n=1 Tax=Nocardia cyriacigeorgica TaxID=135487 RepID=UPI00189534E0|nr:hypothetical protein [Nocardia cyriacigeorgica]MBF6496528.1 hypothetical protein [Nocardia cyriacigeorgica]
MFARMWARLQWEYRYYFVRRKAPLSSILWHRILGRRYTHSGVFPLSVAWIDPDAALSITCGAPGNNHLDIHVYDADRRPVDTVTVALSYRHAHAIDEALLRARRISRTTDLETRIH